MKEGDLVAGRYRLLRPIGTGAMGTVWATRHELLGREYALKIAGAHQKASRTMREMFLREVQIVGKLRHPNIVDIVDAGELGAGEGLYLAMELLQGESLAARIAQRPLPPMEALAVAAAVGRGLAAAHEAGVVHRDLKPENIFLARGVAGGVVPKLLDFGVSSARGIRTLDPGRVFATPAYMSPEQALGEKDHDGRTDVWALGVVMYEMLTGRLPFTASSYAALLPQIIEGPYSPLPEAIPAEVRTVVAGCLAKDRADRYAGAEALLEAIERARTALPPPDSGATPSGLFVEMGQESAPSSRVPSLTALPPREPRHALALAILAIPMVIGIFAAATSVGRGHAGASPGAPGAPGGAALPPAAAATQVSAVTTAEPAGSPGALADEAPGGASSASGPAGQPATEMTAKPGGTARTGGGKRAPATKPGTRSPGRPVTRIDSAGF